MTYYLCCLRSSLCAIIESRWEMCERRICRAILLLRWSTLQRNLNGITKTTHNTSEKHRWGWFLSNDIDGVCKSLWVRFEEDVPRVETGPVPSSTGSLSLGDGLWEWVQVTFGNMEFKQYKWIRRGHGADESLNVNANDATTVFEDCDDNWQSLSVIGSTLFMPSNNCQIFSPAAGRYTNNCNIANLRQ